jgi:hypothetical protein
MFLPKSRLPGKGKKGQDGEGGDLEKGYWLQVAGKGMHECVKG